VIAADLRSAIRAGSLPAGTALPTVTQLGARYHVAPSTIHRAVALLAAEHLVTGRALLGPAVRPEQCRSVFSR
jgi:DNA-binding GntR family transcriptional regulator